MHCRNCGQTLPDEAVFCNKCGARVAMPLPLDKDVRGTKLRTPNIDQDNASNAVPQTSTSRKRRIPWAVIVVPITFLALGAAIILAWPQIKGALSPAVTPAQQSLEVAQPQKTAAPVQNTWPTPPESDPADANGALAPAMPLSEDAVMQAYYAIVDDLIREHGVQQADLNDWGGVTQAGFIDLNNDEIKELICTYTLADMGDQPILLVYAFEGGRAVLLERQHTGPTAQQTDMQGYLDIIQINGRKYLGYELKKFPEIENRRVLTVREGMLVEYMDFVAYQNAPQYDNDMWWDFKLDEYHIITHRANNRIVDDAKLFSQAEKAEFAVLAAEFLAKYDMEIVVHTADTGIDDTQNYADAFYDNHAYGTGDNHAGALLLIDMQNRKTYISTTGIMIDVLDDQRIESILDAQAGFLAAKDYAGAMKKTIALIGSFIEQGIKGSGHVYNAEAGKFFQLNEYGYYSDEARAADKGSSTSTVSKEKFWEQYNAYYEADSMQLDICYGDMLYADYAEMARFGYEPIDLMGRR